MDRKNSALRIFLSLKWKALALTSLVLIAIVASFSILSHLNLLHQFEQQREIIHTHYGLEVQGLVDQSLQKMQLFAELIPTLAGMRNALLADDQDKINAAFNTHWSDLQLNIGLDMAHFYDSSNRLITSWGQTGPQASTDKRIGKLVAQSNALERPGSVLYCRIECMQYVVVPLLVDGKHVGAVLLGSSLRDVVLGFKQIFGVEVGMLIAGEPDGVEAPSDRVIPEWGARVIALTDANRNFSLLETLARQHPNIDVLQTGARVGFRDRHYEVTLIPLGTLVSDKRGLAVTIDDISEPLAEIQIATRENIIIGLSGLVISEVLLLIVLWTPMTRLRRTAHTLPLLAESAYDQVRKSIGRRSKQPLFGDEIDILDTTAVNLAHQLEALEDKVSDRTHTLGERMEELAQERDFVRNLLDTAQVLVLTLDEARNVVMINPYGESLSGYKESELVGKNFADFIDLDEQAPDVPYRLGEMVATTRDQYRHESRLVRRDGSIREVAWLHSRLGKHSGQGPAILSIGLDVTDRKDAESRLSWLADHDPLTRLLNRRRFQEELERAVPSAIRHGHQGAILFFDLDQFKYFNDTGGHQAGDTLLKLVSQSLTMILRDEDTVARVGGDEFAVLLEQSDEAGAIEAARKINAHLNRIQLPVDGHAHKVSASFGIAIFPQHGSKVADLIATADMAMYHAKEAGRGGWHVFSPDDQTRERMHAQVYWTERVESALLDDQFVLHYQPILDVPNNAITHCESLLRMVDHDGGLVRPDAFIGACERSELIHSIDHLVLHKAIAQAAELFNRGQEMCLSINLSGRAFEDRELLPTLRKALADYKVDTHRLIFEITETAAVADFSAAREMINQIRQLGCSFALDDFGVGFSSLTYLKELPVDYVKIDGSFIQNLASDRDDQILVKAMSEVARGFGIKTVAEFVGSTEVLAMLRAFGVDYAQGYYVGHPVPAEQLFGIQAPDVRAAIR